MSALEAAVRNAAQSMAFLDDLPSCMAFPGIITQRRRADIPTLCSLYERAYDMRMSEHVPAVVGLALRMSEFIDGYSEIENLEYRRVWRMMSRRRSFAALGGIENELGTMYMLERAMLYEFVCLLNNGISIRDLLVLARNNDEGSFMRLVQIDKSDLTPWN